MGKIHTFFYSLKNSLFNSRYYKDVEKTSFWFSYKYLFFLLFLILIFKSVQIGFGYLSIRNQIPQKIQIFEDAAYDLYPNELEIHIQNGKLFTNVTEPYVIDIPYQFHSLARQHLLVIDTQGYAEDYPAYNTIALATERTLVYPSKEKERVAPQLFYFSEIKEPFSFDRSMYDAFLAKTIPTLRTLTKFVDVYVCIGLFIFTCIGTLGWLSGQLIFLLPMTGIVWLIVLLAKRKKSYWTLYRLGMHALTWPIVLSVIFDLLHQPLGGMYSLIFLVWTLLIVLGMKKEKAT